MVLYLLNFFVDLLSIAAFVAPFVLWYAIATKRPLRGANANQYLQTFFSSPQANWLIFAWAFSEAIVWFVIPEFLLLMVVFMRVRRKRQMLMYDIAGTLAGTVLALLLRLPEQAIDKLPYIQPKMVEQTKLWFEQQGILALTHQPFSGVPYKVFTNLAWQYEFSLLLFIAMAVFVRIIRYLIAYGLFLSLYPKLHKVVKNNYLKLAVVAIFIFSVLLLKTFNHYR